MRLAALLFVMTSTTVLAQDAPPAASLATAEFAFSARSVATDMREGFLSVLTDDGILFRPGPVNGRDVMLKNPAPPIELNWRPAVVHVAASGDMGYSTGPARIQSKIDPSRPPSYTHFLSIWEKRSGVWKLRVDVGINHAEPFLADGWLELSSGSGPGPGEAAFLAAEKAFNDQSESQGYGAALNAHADANIRVYRTPLKPFLGRASLAGHSFGPVGLAGQVIEHGISRSGDVAWSIIKLGRRDQNGTVVASSHALRVWRAQQGRFLLVADLVSDMPR